MIGGAILLLGGGSGVAAIIIGKDALFGPSKASLNGLECTTAQTVNIKKSGSFWIRKFVRVDGGTGEERLKTALRVAKAVYDKEKPDLVQVSLLDSKGPTMRSEMRGRAVSAQAIYIADPSKFPEDANAKSYSAFYYDGDANSAGQFYGMRIDVPVEDAERLTASLQDHADCIDPVADAPADAHGGTKASGGHGEAAPAHGEGEAKPAEGHGGESAPSASDHGTPTPADGGGHGSEEQLLTSTHEAESPSMFSLAYIKSLIFGKGTVTAEAADAHAPAEGATNHDAPPAEGVTNHDAPPPEAAQHEAAPSESKPEH